MIKLAFSAAFIGLFFLCTVQARAAETCYKVRFKFIVDGKPTCVETTEAPSSVLCIDESPLTPSSIANVSSGDIKIKVNTVEGGEIFVAIYHAKKEVVNNGENVITYRADLESFKYIDQGDLPFVFTVDPAQPSDIALNMGERPFCATPITGLF